MKAHSPSSRRSAVGMASGLSNADFARLFRREAMAEKDAPTDSPGDGEEAVNPMMQAAMRRNNEDDEAWEQEDDYTDAPHVGLGFTPHQEASENGDVVMEEEQTHERARVLTEAELKRKFTWEKHTTGFGLKMMAKMGFTGRLGKDEKGVSSTLEVVQRPNQMGLGFGSFKEAGSLKQNKRIEKELRGETVGEEQERETREREALEEDDSLWRKRKVPTGGRSYKKAADVSQQAHSQKPRNEIILDMRGPDVRVLNQLTDAYVDQGKVDAARPKLGEELIYNVRMVVNLAQGRIYDLTQKIDTNTATLDSMHKEAKILKAQVDSDALRWSKIEEMMHKMTQLEAIATDARESLSIEKVLHATRELRACHPREFEAYKIVQTVPSLVNATLKSLVLSSNMLNAEAFHFVLAQFQQLQLFLLESHESDDMDGLGNGISVLHHIREKSSSLGDDVYNYILEETLWPGAGQMVNVQWDIKRDPTGCAQWFRAFRPHLSDEFASGFLHQLVLPKLKGECQRWTPEASSTMMHEWLEPWFQHVELNLESIYPDIQLGLGNALSQLHPSNLTVLQFITPWRDIWGEAEYGQFTHRYILRKLIRCLHREFEVDPHNQSLDALRWILAWQNHIPERQFIALFEGEFFPKWLKVLHKWVVDKPDLSELETWYMGWKKFFSKHQLATEARLIVYFQGALVLLEAAVMRELDTTYPVPALNRFAPTSYQEALVRAKANESTDEETAALHREAEKKPRPKPSTSVNVKDLVEHLAIENDLTFMPKGRHDGQQVYIFGTHHILIEQGVVFVEKAKGDFRPVDIEDLVPRRQQ